MVITANDLLRLEREPLFEFLGIEDDKEFYYFLINEGLNPKSAEDFAMYMSQYYDICSTCGSKYVMLGELCCDTCTANIYRRY